MTKRALACLQRAYDPKRETEAAEATSRERGGGGGHTGDRHVLLFPWGGGGCGRGGRGGCVATTRRQRARSSSLGGTRRGVGRWEWRMRTQPQDWWSCAPNLLTHNRAAPSSTARSCPRLLVLKVSKPTEPASLPCLPLPSSAHAPQQRARTFAPLNSSVEKDFNSNSPPAARADRRRAQPWLSWSNTWWEGS